MTASADWRDALAGLRGAMPDPEPKAAPEAAPEAPKRPAQKLQITLDRKRRGGKVSTIITGFTLSDSEVDEIAATLRRRLATGGSARGGEILIQGDRRAEVERLLKELL